MPLLGEPISQRKKFPSPPTTTLGGKSPSPSDIDLKSPSPSATPSKHETPSKFLSSSATNTKGTIPIKYPSPSVTPHKDETSSKFLSPLATIVKGKTRSTSPSPSNTLPKGEIPSKSPSPSAAPPKGGTPSKSSSSSTTPPKGGTPPFPPKAKSKSSFPTPPVPYRAYRVEYPGKPNHEVLFVETHERGDNTGHVYHILGNSLHGMTYEHRRSKRPEASTTFVAKHCVGTISVGDYSAVNGICQSIPVPGAPRTLDGKKKDPNQRIRPCAEWTSNAIHKMRAKGVLKN